VPYASYAGLGDTVLDIKVTPNRADCLGVRASPVTGGLPGLGRLKRSIRHRSRDPFPRRSTSFSKIHSACRCFVDAICAGPYNGPSPAWLARQTARGRRAAPISTLSTSPLRDLSDLNRPLHVFDAGGSRADLVVRFGAPGETLLALNARNNALMPR